MKSSKPWVSVIIIFLNTERFIREAIESVFAQTYEHWELLLVDDGSTDTSTEIARSYASQNPGQVCYLEHPNHANRGKDASRNLGIQQAQGEYIAFLDADDLWLPHKLKEQVAILEAHPEAGMLYGETQYWYSWTQNPEDIQRDFVPALGVQPNTLISPPKLLPLFLRGKAAVPCTCSILVRCSVVKEINGFDEAFNIYNLYEDQAFYVKVCLKAPVLVSNRCWDKYRQHPDASVAVAHKTGREYDAQRFFLEWLAGYLVKQGITDSEIWQALQQEFWRTCHLTWLPFPEHTQKWVRWMKKWLLRLEEIMMPATISRWLWLR